MGANEICKQNNMQVKAFYMRGSAVEVRAVSITIRFHFQWVPLEHRNQFNAAVGGGYENIEATTQHGNGGEPFTLNQAVPT